MDAEFVSPFNVPPNVREEGYEIPGDKPRIVLNTKLCNLSGKVGEYINEGFRYLREEYFQKFNHTKQIAENKESIKKLLERINKLMVFGGDYAMGLPQEIKDALAFLEIKWPPVD